MIHIYPVSLEMVAKLKKLADTIGQFDRDQARQLKRSSVSVVLNVAEGSGARAGSRRQRYCDALGSARETLANLEAACAVGYLPSIDPTLRSDFRQIIGTLVKLVR